MARVVAVSDLNGYLCPNLPAGDLLIIAGGISPLYNFSPGFQQEWWDTAFQTWFFSLPHPNRVFVPGNTDTLLAAGVVSLPVALQPHCLMDASGTFAGLNVYGTPWQNAYGYGSAFTLPDSQLTKKFALIPKGLDILVTRIPPSGCNDLTMTGQNVGSSSLLTRLKTVKPRGVVSGLVREAHGTCTYDGIWMANASISDENGVVRNNPTIFDW